MEYKMNDLIQALNTIQDFGVTISSKKARNGKIVKIKTEMSNEMIAKMLIRAGIFNK